MKNTLHKAARCLLFTILATVTPLARSVVYVDGAAAGLENGTSWANAYKDLRAAMAASPANAEIWVAAGVYKPGPSRVDSPCLHQGDPASDYSLEPYPDGSRINLGAYGNTEQASKRVAASMMLLR